MPDVDVAVCPRFETRVFPLSSCLATMRTSAAGTVAVAVPAGLSPAELRAFTP